MTAELTVKSGLDPHLTSGMVGRRLIATGGVTCGEFTSGVTSDINLLMTTWEWFHI